MYKCNNCNHEFPTPTNINESGSNLRDKWVSVCPFCFSEDFYEKQEVKQKTIYDTLRRTVKV